MLHFAVTPSFWRGVVYPSQQQAKLKRACDWAWDNTAQFDDVDCEDCLAYAIQLERMGLYKVRKPKFLVD